MFYILNQSFLRIGFIPLFHIVALSFYVVYIISIGSDFSIFSGLSLLSSVPKFRVQINQSTELIDDKPSRGLSKAEREKFTLTAEKKEILVGLYLGDLFAQKLFVNPILHFKQGLVHKDYLMLLYKLFQSYCKAEPKISSLAPDKRTGKEYSHIRFHTYALPCFLESYNLFYHGGVKVVPLNIGDLLTPLGLAFWICDDGSWNKQCGYEVLCTESFTLEEVNLLINVLNEKFDLKCYIQKQGSGFRIVIPSYSILRLQTLLAPIKPYMMRHKIGL